MMREDAGIAGIADSAGIVRILRKLDYLNFNKKVKLQNQYLAKFARGTCAAF